VQFPAISIPVVLLTCIVLGAGNDEDEFGADSGEIGANSEKGPV
jgi:hypothetical protein